MSKNRILKYLDDDAPPHAKCVVVSDIANQCVTMTVNGQKLVWQWTENEALLCPGAAKETPINPFAAEALIEEEVYQFLSISDISNNEVAYVTAGGEKLDGVMFHPLILGVPTYTSVVMKEKIKEIYGEYVRCDNKLTCELIGECISFGVLAPFLSIVNL